MKRELFGRTFVFGQEGKQLIEERGRILRGVKQVFELMKAESLPINEINRKQVEKALADGWTPERIVAGFREEYQ